MDPSSFTPPDLTERLARRIGRRREGRRERPFRFLLDSRVFRLLCGPGQAAAVANFRAALAHHGLAPEGGLPELEMTPVAILDAIGVEPPSFPTVPLPKSMATLKTDEIAIVVMKTIQEQFRKAPQLEPASLQRRVDELREKADPAAHELFDLCLTRDVSGEELAERIVEQVSFDALFTFRFPEEYRERMNGFFDSSLLLSHEARIAGLTKMRRLKLYWDRSLERILKKHPLEREEILAADQEMRPRTFKDFLGWEVIHHAVLGYARERVHPVIAFSPEPADRLRARCKAHKTAMRAFLDEIPREELAGELRPQVRAWTPGRLVPCRADGTLDAPVLTEEVLVWAA